MKSQATGFGHHDRTRRNASSLPVRIPWRYHRRVHLPTAFRSLVWDEHGGTVPLEKLILRIVTYGTFDELSWVYRTYPEETFDLVQRYPDIRRGVRYWVRVWHDR